jgi:hypothetical protein
MKDEALQLITECREAATREKSELTLTFEDGNVVDINLAQQVISRELCDKIKEYFQSLTGRRFYGKLHLEYKYDKVDRVKIVKSIKL